VRVLKKEPAAIKEAGKTPVLGLDMEWTVCRGRRGQQANVEVFQLSTKTRTLFIHVACAGMPHKLETLLSNAMVLNVCCRIRADVKRLKQKWRDVEVAEMKDLGVFGKVLGLVARWL